MAKPPRLRIPRPKIAAPRAVTKPAKLPQKPLARRERSTVRPVEADRVLDRADISLLDLVDNLLNRGVLIQGEVVLGIANVDLIFLRLQLILCAADRVLPAKR